MSRKPKVPTLVECLHDIIEDAARRAALQPAAEVHYGRLGEALVEHGLVTPEELARALARQAQLRGRRHEAWQHLHGALANTTAITLALAGGGRR